MKLMRVGELGSEKPVLIDAQNKYRDLSTIIKKTHFRKEAYMQMGGRAEDSSS